MRDTFSTYHPLITFTYYFAVILFAMLFLHPVFLGLSFLCGLVYSVRLKGVKALKVNLALLLALIVFSAIFNSLFSHYGVTPLFTLPGGNKFTLESFIYGLVSGTMLASVIQWFSCYHQTMTSDKFIYLFGRVIPALSLIFSMVLRFVPRYKAQIKVIADGQRCLGRDWKSGSVFQKARNGLNILSILITWALENAIETADSMRSRGYGLRGRTAFSIYRFDNRDRLFLIVLAFLIVVVLTGAALNQNNILYNPEIVMNKITPFSYLVYAHYAVLCLMPVLVDVLMSWKWRGLKKVGTGYSLTDYCKRGELWAAKN